MIALWEEDRQEKEGKFDKFMIERKVMKIMTWEPLRTIKLWVMAEIKLTLSWRNWRWDERNNACWGLMWKDVMIEKLFRELLRELMRLNAWRNVRGNKHKANCWLVRSNKGNLLERRAIIFKGIRECRWAICHWSRERKRVWMLDTRESLGHKHVS